MCGALDLLPVSITGRILTDLKLHGVVKESRVARPFAVRKPKEHDVVSRFGVFGTRATADTAIFLDKLDARLASPLRAIQVDGASRNP